MENNDVETVEKLLKDKEEELEVLREKERSVFYSDIRRALISILSETKDFKSTSKDFKIFKSQMKATLFIQNVLWCCVIILIEWFLKK